jgi:hypothetical protein
VADPGWRPVHRHEIMHVFSLRLWGYPGTSGWSDSVPTLDAWRRGSWLREGIAAAAEDLCGRFTYRAIAAQMQAEGQLFPFATLRDAFLEQDDLPAYLQAGSLVQYLLETYGQPRFRELWRSNGDDFERVYAASVSTIEAAWHAWLRSTTDERPPSVAALREQACAPR